MNEFTPSDERRFWARVDKTASGDCWRWTGSHDKDGYGWFQMPERLRRAHQVSYELAVGPIPEGLQLDHLCRTRDCVNPAHMEPVTVRENVLRGVGLTAQNARKTHCYRGHPLSGPNLRVYFGPQGRARICRECSRSYHRERYAKGLG